MQNEGTRAEVAQSFKDQGNEAVSELRWIDAKEHYTKAIAVIYAKEDKWEKPEDLAEEKKSLRNLDELSHINRARCNLELGMFVFSGMILSITHTSILSRKLPVMYPRLRSHPQAQPHKR